MIKILLPHCLKTLLVLVITTYPLDIALACQALSSNMVPSAFVRPLVISPTYIMRARAMNRSKSFCRITSSATAGSSSANRVEEHSAFVERMLSLTGDPLEQEGGRVVVFRGNPEARLMLIGEAPGAEEDKAGEPFIGRSGQLLNDILRAVGIDPERDVYVSNIVRRRPLENRTPTSEELEFYLPLLLEEIRLVDPHVIVTLGASSTKVLLPHETRGITKTRGQWVPNEELVDIHGGTLDGRRVMPWFHPSYLLRNGGEKSRQEGGVRWLTREDLREVKRTLQALTL